MTWRQFAILFATWKIGSGLVRVYWEAYTAQQARERIFESWRKSVETFREMGG